MARKAQSKSSSYERAANGPIAITPVEYSEWQEAFDHFNKRLFEGALPDVFLTYQRKANSDGYFSPNRFADRGDKVGAKAELSLNPDKFRAKSDEQICQTLARLMVQVWQYARGTLPSRGYCNEEASAKMKAIGLYPSSTGAPGGSETGQRMSSYIVADGAFANAYAELAASGWRLNLESADRPGPKGRANTSKTAFTCANCGQNVWGKADVAVTCTPCVIQALGNGLGASAALELVERHQMRARTIEAPPASMPASLPLLELLDQRAAEDQSAAIKEDQPTVQFEEPVLVRRKRGRPKGSKNKRQSVTVRSYEEAPILKKKRGRPKGLKNKRKAVPSYDKTDRQTA